MYNIPSNEYVLCKFVFKFLFCNLNVFSNLSK